jgi:hypothetical protein
MDPVIEEFCRAHDLRTEVFRRMQRYFRDIIVPRLDAADAVIAERDELRLEVAKLREGRAKQRAGVPA